MFDYQKPTVQILGRWQPWHAAHQELFKRAHAKTGQVNIMIRDTGEHFKPAEVMDRIEAALMDDDFYLGRDYIMTVVPNIVNITYGRDVGYTIEQENLGEEMHKISATAIRREMGIG